MKSFDGFVAYANSKGSNFSEENKVLLKATFDHIYRQGIDPFDINSYDFNQILGIVDLKKHKFLMGPLRRSFSFFKQVSTIYDDYMQQHYQ